MLEPFASAVNWMWHHPKYSAVLTTILTWIAGILVVYFANFGTPLLVYVPLFLLLCTLGAPTTLGVVLVASIWGRVSVFTGLVGFLLVAAVSGLVLQITVFVLWSRWHQRRHPERV